LCGFGVWGVGLCVGLFFLFFGGLWEGVEKGEEEKGGGGGGGGGGGSWVIHNPEA